MMRVLNGCKTVAEIPASKLADDAPIYEREARPKETAKSAKSAKEFLDEIPFPPPAFASFASFAVHSLLALLSHPSIASKNWVYRQYDHMVRAGTCVLPGSDAAVFLIREADKIVAATTDCNALYCTLDPREGAKIAVAEAARNLACSGAMPLALTDNLNFGNPYKPENFWQLRESVEGLAEACRMFNTPITGGNVSLYNENPNGAIDPTPTVGMVGLIENEKHITRQAFRDAGDVIILIGDLGNELGGSHFLKIIHGKKAGT